MKKIVTSISVILILFVLQTFFAPPVRAQTVDVINFMRAIFNYNGFTQNNSYLARIVHIYNKDQKTWTHGAELPSCPTGLTPCTGDSIYKTRSMTRQKPGENILYLNKEAYSLLYPGVISQIPEVFWFDKDTIYVFEEGYVRGERGDVATPGLFGLFHNFSMDPGATNLPLLGYPNRGQFWTKRLIASGDITQWFTGLRTKGEFKNMVLRPPPDGNVGEFAYEFRVKVTYHPIYDSSVDSWNHQKDISDLPQPLEVLEVSHEWRDKVTHNNKGGEKYFYARNGSNSFGLIRYELWQPKADVCGSTTCCTTPQCDANNPNTLTVEDTYQLLRHYDQGDNPDRYFTPDFYSDPKLEKYPGTPTNGALIRGAFQLPGDGQTTDGTVLKAGDWVQLTEVLTDADWMLSKYIAPNQCPDGYQFLGSFAPPSFIDFQTNTHTSTTWSVLCGTNKNVLLASSCPANYESRGWFYGPNLPTSSYDYQGKDISRQKVNYCVHYNEFHYPKQSVTAFSSLLSPTLTPTPTPTPTPAILPGDLNKDGKVDMNDYNLLITNFGNPYSIYDYAILAGAIQKAAPTPTPTSAVCGQKAGCRNTD